METEVHLVPRYHPLVIEVQIVNNSAQPAPVAAAGRLAVRKTFIHAYTVEDWSVPIQTERSGS